MRPRRRDLILLPQLLPLPPLHRLFAGRHRLTQRLVPHPLPILLFDLEVHALRLREHLVAQLAPAPEFGCVELGEPERQELELAGLRQPGLVVPGDQLGIRSVVPPLRARGLDPRLQQRPHRLLGHQRPEAAGAQAVLLGRHRVVHPVLEDGDGGPHARRRADVRVVLGPHQVRAHHLLLVQQAAVRVEGEGAVRRRGVLVAAVLHGNA
ncbi:hypothetical protein PG999_001726 [Apiospora kogelbergensis]|uniref:Secreted protein n=1 Tax=Apiospora kogelbergensis TaxID=1337665 RepID=A0AAW0R6A5_9PEZI